MNELIKNNSELKNIINEFRKLPELKDLNQRQIEKLAKAAFFDKLKEDFKKEIKKDKIDKNNLINKWLDLFDSEETKRSFSRNLKYFFAYLGNKSILDVNAFIVDDYLSYLKHSRTIGRIDRRRTLSDASIRQRIAACSSFWQSLVRWEIVSMNPFKGSKLPKKLLQVKKPEKIPTHKQLIECENYCRTKINCSGGKGSFNRKRSAIKALAALIILRNTGLRVGALPSLMILDNGYYTAKTKGGTASGKLNIKTIKELKKIEMFKRYPFKNYKSFRMFFYKMIRELDFNFSIHGIRHYFAIRFYNKNGKDIEKLRSVMGHKTTIPTMSYLAGKL